MNKNLSYKMLLYNKYYNKLIIINNSLRLYPSHSTNSGDLNPYELN